MIRKVALRLDTLGKRLKHARTTAHQRVPSAYGKVTQDNLAKLIGVSRNAITMIEKDKVKSMEPVKLSRIAKYLHVNALWLLNGEGPVDVEIKTNDSNKNSNEPSVMNEMTNDDFIDHVSAINALTNQILENADKGRSNKRLKSMLQETVTEYLKIS